MSSLQELLAQKAEIDRQISDARRQERNEAVSKVRALMAEHGLTAADLAAAPAKGQESIAGTKVEPKYLDPASGAMRTLATHTMIMLAAIHSANWDTITMVKILILD